MTQTECKKAAEMIYGLVLAKGTCNYSVDEIMNQLSNFNAEYRIYKSGDICVKAGSSADTIAYVLSGILHQCMPTEIGDAMLMRAVRPGEFAAFSLIYNSEMKVHPVDYVAFRDTEVVVLDVARVRVWRQDPSSGPFFEYIGRELCRSLYESWTKTMVLGGKDIAERVMRYLAIRVEKEKSHTITVPGTEEDFANYLCVNATALSRVLNKLRDNGRISYKRNVITVL